MIAMTNLKLFRRRFIPEEIVELKDDKILSIDKINNIIITTWNVLKPRNDIDHGISAYFINDGIKVSKIFNSDGNLVYWYCDIIETVHNNNTYTFNDLLIDIIIHPDGKVEVVDMDEFADVMENGILTNHTIAKALRCANSLLKDIYSGNFGKYTRYIEKI